MTQLDAQQAELADLLFELGAIKFASAPGEFRLKLHETNPDAPLSPIYLNLRTADHPKNPGPLDAKAMTLIRSLMWMATVGGYDCYADIPDAGTPFGDEFQHAEEWRDHPAERLTLEKVVDEATGKRHITDKVEGNFFAGQSVVLIDDLITQAHSKLEAIEALKANGLEVTQVLVLVDRDQGGSEQLTAAGYPLVAVFRLTQLLDHYVAQSFITEAKAREVRDYLAANRVN